MTAPGSGALRVARAVVLALCGLLLAVGGHVAGAGAPSPAAVLVVAAFSAATCLLLADRRLGVRAIAACTAAAQGAFHVVMTLEPVHAAGTGPAMAHPPGARMLLAHVVATVLTTLLLARGEHLVWTLAALLAPVVRLLVPRGTAAGSVRPWRPRAGRRPPGPGHSCARGRVAAPRAAAGDRRLRSAPRRARRRRRSTVSRPCGAVRCLRDRTLP